jgi:hypothetical protein
MSHRIHKLASLAFSVFVLSVALGCGEITTPENSRVFKQGDTAKIAGLAQADVIGASIDGMVGQVSQLERSDGTLSVVVYTDPENMKGQMIVDTPDEELKEDDVVRFSGKVTEYFKGENMMGVELAMPRVEASDFEVLDARALNPALETVKVGRSKDLAGVKITVVRAELAENQTRIWVRYKNNSSEDFMSDPSLTADGEEVEEDYSDDYKMPATSVSSGAKTSGVLVFKPIKPGSRMKLTYDGYDSNFNEIKVVFKFGG